MSQWIGKNIDNLMGEIVESMQAFGGAVVFKVKVYPGKTTWRINYQLDQGCQPTSKRLIFLMKYQAQRLAQKP